VSRVQLTRLRAGRVPVAMWWSCWGQRVAHAVKPDGRPWSAEPLPKRVPGAALGAIEGLGSPRVMCACGRAQIDPDWRDCWWPHRTRDPGPHTGCVFVLPGDDPRRLRWVRIGGGSTFELFGSAVVESSGLIVAATPWYRIGRCARRGRHAVTVAEQSRDGSWRIDAAGQRTVVFTRRAAVGPAGAAAVRIPQPGRRWPSE